MTPYLIGATEANLAAGERFRARLAQPGILRLPGAHCGLAAIQARRAGFEAVYLSGAAMSASMGLPDLGILTIDDVCVFIRQLARAGGLPVLVDGDTGYGEALNAMHMVRAFEEAGAAAVHLEDQRLPKKCGHLNDKRLVPMGEMAAKVAAAVRARRHLVVVARTDAVASEGFDAAVDRARAYLAAGADAIFPEALTSEAMLRDFARALPGVPLLANMTEFGRSPDVDAATLESWGYRMVIWPVSSLRIAAGAVERLYDAIARDGRTTAVLPDMLTRAALYEAIDLAAYEALDRELVATVL